MIHGNKKIWNNINRKKKNKQGPITLVSGRKNLQEKTNFVSTEMNAKTHTKKKVHGTKKVSNNKNSHNKKKAPEMVNKVMANHARCKGAPLKIPGKKGVWGNWGNLGKGSAEDCKEACLAEPTCKFAVFQSHNGHCSAFASCNKPKVGKYKKGPQKGQVKPFLVFEKADKPEEPEEPQEPEKPEEPEPEPEEAEKPEEPEPEPEEAEEP